MHILDDYFILEKHHCNTLVPLRCMVLCSLHFSLGYPISETNYRNTSLTQGHSKTKRNLFELDITLIANSYYHILMSPMGMWLWLWLWFTLNPPASKMSLTSFIVSCDQEIKTKVTIEEKCGIGSTIFG